MRVIWHDAQQVREQCITFMLDPAAAPCPASVAVNMCSLVAGFITLRAAHFLQSSQAVEFDPVRVRALRLPSASRVHAVAFPAPREVQLAPCAAVEEGPVPAAAAAPAQPQHVAAMHCDDHAAYMRDDPRQLGGRGTLPATRAPSEPSSDDEVCFSDSMEAVPVALEFPSGLPQGPHSLDTHSHPHRPAPTRGAEADGFG